MIHSSVLIETYWNVKMEIKADSTALFSINRNILECKDEQNHGAGRCGACINRNILECKVILDRKEKFQEWEY